MEVDLDLLLQEPEVQAVEELVVVFLVVMGLMEQLTLVEELVVY